MKVWMATAAAVLCGSGAAWAQDRPSAEERLERLMRRLDDLAERLERVERALKSGGEGVRDVIKELPGRMHVERSDRSGFEFHEIPLREVERAFKSGGDEIRKVIRELPGRMRIERDEDSGFRFFEHPRREGEHEERFILRGVPGKIMERFDFHIEDFLDRRGPGRDEFRSRVPEDVLRRLCRDCQRKFERERDRDRDRDRDDDD